MVKTGIVKGGTIMPDCMKHIRPGRFCFQCEDEWRHSLQLAQDETRKAWRDIAKKDDKLEVSQKCNVMLEDENFRLRELNKELGEEIEYLENEKTEMCRDCKWFLKG